MTLCDLDLWPHDFGNLYSTSTCNTDTPYQIWWRSDHPSQRKRGL